MFLTLHCFEYVTVKLQVHIFYIYFFKCPSFLFSVYFTFHEPGHCCFQKFLTVWMQQVNHWLFSLEFCHKLIKTGLMLIRNAISVSTSFDSSAFLVAMYLSLLLTLASFGNSTCSNLLTASLIFTSHSKAGIRESQ